MNKNVTAIILIVLGIGVYFTVTQNILDDANVVKEVNKEYLAAIKSADELIKVRDRVLEQWKEISPDDQKNLDKMIPGTVDNIRLIIDLNSVALKHGFSLKNIQASADESSSNSSSLQVSQQVPGSAVIANPTLDTVNISFSVTAPYLQFISFLQDLEANLRIMDLTHLSVTATDTGTYDFGVELKTYWLRQ